MVAWITTGEVNHTAAEAMRGPGESTAQRTLLASTKVGYTVKSQAHP